MAQCHNNEKSTPSWSGTESSRDRSPSPPEELDTPLHRVQTLTKRTDVANNIRGVLDMIDHGDRDENVPYKDEDGFIHHAPPLQYLNGVAPNVAAILQALPPSRGDAPMAVQHALQAREHVKGCSHPITAADGHALSGGEVFGVQLKLDGGSEEDPADPWPLMEVSLPPGFEFAPHGRQETAIRQAIWWREGGQLVLDKAAAAGVTLREIGITIMILDFVRVNRLSLTNTCGGYVL